MKKKVLKNYKLKIDTNEIEIDADAFGESLLICAPRVREICGYIDDAINRVAMISYEPFVSTQEQCEYIIDSIYTKRQLMDLNKVAADWYKALSDKQKRNFKSYFVEKQNGTKAGYQKNYKRIQVRRGTVVLPLVHSFMSHVRSLIDFNEKALIENVYIWGTYVEVLRRINNNRKNNGANLPKKGVKKHDNSTNERCDCCGV